jgi:outer membrane protein assembly factor BamB
MVKKIGIVAACLVVVSVALLVAGYRLNRNGSGMPAIGSKPDYDALERDRARQKQEIAAANPSVERPGTVAQVTAPVDGAPPPPTEAEPAIGGAVRAEWPDFRGPNRDGRYAGAPILTSWPREGLRRVWKQPIGLGYASFVVADGRAFTIEQRRRQEVASAYDVTTGRELWTNGWDAEFRESMGGDGPRATPTYHEGRVYALGAEGELRVLDARSGAVAWRKNILTDNNASNISWGMSASPLIVDDKVIVLPGGRRGHSVVAYNKATGAPTWKSQDDQQSYTSPMTMTIGGVRQIVVVSAERAMGLTVDAGRLLWEYPWNNGYAINVAQPILFQRDGKDFVFLSASYGAGAVVFEVTRNGERFGTRKVWENQRMKNKFTSSVLQGGYLYGLDESILACLDAMTGEQKWKGGRYGYGQVLLAGDHLIVLTEDGDVVLVNATPERHEELARFPAIEGKTWNHPVIAGGKLLVRNVQEMAAFDIAAP